MNPDGRLPVCIDLRWQLSTPLGQRAPVLPISDGIVQQPGRHEQGIDKKRQAVEKIHENDVPNRNMGEYMLARLTETSWSQVQ
jgi:hypothetical protein